MLDESLSGSLNLTFLGDGVAYSKLASPTSVNNDSLKDMLLYRTDKYNFSAEIPFSSNARCGKLIVNANQGSRDGEDLA